MAKEIIRIMRFSAVGLLATLVHACVYAALVAMTEVLPLMANAIAFAAAVGMSFFGHAFWTFNHGMAQQVRRNISRPLGRFLAVSITTLALSNFLVYTVTEGFGLHPLLAIIPMISIVPVSTYLLLKLWVFVPCFRSQEVKNEL